MNLSPKVSVCLPVLNTGRFLKDRIASIRAQTFQDFEVVVIDGFSDDGSWELLQKAAAEDFRFRLYQEPRRGIYPAFNAGIERCRGELVYIATSDDTMEPACLELMVEALQLHPECGLGHCELIGLDEHGDELPVFWRSKPNMLSFPPEGGPVEVRKSPHDGLLQMRGCSAYFSLTQLLIRKKVFETVGLFRNDWGPKGDFEWNLRAALVFDTVHLPRKLASWRQHPKQATTAFQDSAEFWKPFPPMIDEAMKSARRATRAAWTRRVGHSRATLQTRRRIFWADYFARAGTARIWHVVRWLVRDPRPAIEALLWRMKLSRGAPFSREAEVAWLLDLFRRAEIEMKSPFPKA